MAWRYSSSTYTPRDRSSSRDSSSISKYGSPSLSTSSYSSADRPSRWSSSQTTTRDPPAAASRSNSVEEHGPIWAKTSIHSNPSSLVQRLKERYKVPDTPKTSTTITNRPDTKDLSLPLSRTYGRSTTTNYNSLDASKLEKPKGNDISPNKTEKSIYSYNRADTDHGSSLYSSRSSLRKRTPEPEKNSSYEYRTRKPEYTPIEGKPKIYTSSSLGSSPATSRYLNKKLSGSSTSSPVSTPNTPITPSTEKNYVLEKFERAQEKWKENIDKKDYEEETITVVTRGTSPTQPSSSIYVRTRRADSARTIEKTITRPKLKHKMVDKETQADESSSSTNHLYTDRPKPRASYSSYTPASTVSRYSGRSSTYAPITISRYSSEFRRSSSREPAPLTTPTEEPLLTKPPVKTPDTPISSPVKVTPTSPVQQSTANVNQNCASPGVSIKQPSTSPVSSVRQTSISPVSTVKQTSTSPVTSVKQKSASPIKETGTKLRKSTSKSSLTSPILSKSASKEKLSKTTSPSNLKEKSASPVTSKTSSNSKNEEVKARSRSRTQDSDTNISVSGFSDSSKASVPLKLVSKTISPIPPTPPPQDDNDSESESESDETATTTTTDSETGDELEELTKSTEPSSIKKSITNFLLNNGEATHSRSRLSVLAAKTGSQPKFKFNRLESGERAWWLESNNNVPEGVLKLSSTKSMHKMAEQNLLAPNHLSNRQFSRDKDWLKSSSEDVSEKSPTTSPLPPRPPGTPSPSRQPTLSVPGDNTLFLDVPKLPVVRQWSDEKPWWLSDNENSSRDNSISVEKELRSHSSPVNGVSEGDISNKIPIEINSFPSCDGKLSPSKSPTAKISPEKFIAIEDDGEDIDVTPALRRRREQASHGNIPNQVDVPEYQMKFNQDQEENLHNGKDPKTFLDECKLECSVRDLTQKLATVTNGLANQEEEKQKIEVGDMSGMISKAKAGLMNSQTKYDERQGSEDLAPKVKDLEKSEIDIYWKELVDSLDRPLMLCDIDFTDLNEDDEKDIFSHSRANGEVPPPPPPFLLANGPIPALPNLANPPPPLRIIQPPTPPPPMLVKNKKTVKLFWKEVNDFMFPVKSSNGSIWQELQPVSVDTAKLEQLFESRAKDFITKKQQEQNKIKAVVVLDNKRSNAINIGMTKLPPPRAIKAAILKMDTTVVTKEGIEKLLTMLPTEEETVRIEDAQVANPDLPLGSAEQFLLTLASISELEARLKLWAFKMDYENSEKEICEPLQDLKLGLDILRSNRTFRGILSTLLSIGNFLNGQEAKGFQIDYLSKVPEVKDTVNKHSLLHHLCVFVMEKFPDSTDLYSEIGPVTRASKTDFDELAANIKKIEDDCKCSWNHLKVIAKHEGQTTMKAKMSDFLADCAERIILIGVVHRRIMCRFQKLVLWLGVPMNRISTTRPHDLFKTIAEFALEYRTTRERILQQMKKISHHKEKSRSKINVAHENHTAPKKMNSKEAKEDAKLRQLLTNDNSTAEALTAPIKWRRQKKETALASNDCHDDSEILQTLIKTASKEPSNREAFKERRRSRVADRKLCKKQIIYLNF